MGDRISKQISKSDILTLQDSKDETVYYLQTGSVEILIADPEFNGLDKHIVVDNSRRIGFINEATFLVGYSGRTIRAVTDCTVQEFPLQSGFSSMFASDPGAAILMLNCLVKRLESSYSDLNRAIKLYQNLCRISDNIAILFKELSSSDLPPALLERTENLYGKFKEGGGTSPTTIDSKFIITDRAKILKKDYNIPGEPIESLINKEFLEFTKKILGINKNIIAHMIKADQSIAEHIHSSLSGSMSKVLDKIDNVYTKIDSEMSMAFGGSNSWMSVLFDNNAIKEWIGSGRIVPDFLPQMVPIIEKLYSVYGELTGENMTDTYPGLDKINLYISNRKNEKVVTPKANSVTENGDTVPSASAQSSKNDINGSTEIDPSVIRLYSNSMQQIFQFAVASNDLQRDVLKSLNEFKKMKNPFDTEADARKVRRAVTKYYWDLYCLVYLRVKSQPPSIPAPVKLFLLYGFLDENMVDPEQLMALHQMSVDKFKTKKITILYEHEFLSFIHASKEDPSVNEMGITYQKYLQELTRTAKKGENPLDDYNDPVKRATYEIMNMLQNAVSICSGSRSTAFPIFTNLLVRGNIRNFIFTKQEIEKIVEEILQVDYSLFYRETVLKLETAREVVEEEVFPNIILLPSIGSKTMMWQELSGVSKKTRARIVVPVIFNGDIRKNLAHSFAVFRWELNRTIKGAMWSDPIEGGLTGAYNDYIQFYKKNSRLSVEAKEKLADRIRACRNNIRELFAEDYYLWIFFEKEGILKLNNVVRDLFYRYIPFRKELRETLEKMPAFTESAVRFKNVRTRIINGYNIKFRKYQDGNGNYHPEIQKFMDYMQM